MKLRPLHDNVLVKRTEEEAKTGENTRKRNGTAKQHQRGIIREISQSDAW